jgi:hypothetical protein
MKGLNRRLKVAVCDNSVWSKQRQQPGSCAHEKDRSILCCFASRFVCSMAATNFL